MIYFLTCNFFVFKDNKCHNHNNQSADKRKSKCKQNVCQKLWLIFNSQKTFEYHKRHTNIKQQIAQWFYHLAVKHFYLCQYKPRYTQGKHKQSVNNYCIKRHINTFLQPFSFFQEKQQKALRPQKARSCIRFRQAIPQPRKA